RMAGNNTAERGREREERGSESAVSKVTYLEDEGNLSPPSFSRVSALTSTTSQSFRVFKRRYRLRRCVGMCRRRWCAVVWRGECHWKNRSEQSHTTSIMCATSIGPVTDLSLSVGVFVNWQPII